MEPVLHVHPSWLPSDQLHSSDTWRWFHFERWSALLRGDQGVEIPAVGLNPTMPPQYQSILRVALWIVAEAVRRDGVSRDHLDGDDMRWSRRLGLALFADAPVPHVASEPAGRTISDREGAAGAYVRQLINLFPEQDRPCLMLSIPQPTALDESERAVPAPSPKLVMLVRLAKRHAAARHGIEWLESTEATPDASQSETAWITLDSDDVGSSPASGIQSRANSNGELHHDV